MKKLIIIFFVLILLMTGCNADEVDTQSDMEEMALNIEKQRLVAEVTQLEDNQKKMTESIGTLNDEIMVLKKMLEEPIIESSTSLLSTSMTVIQLIENQDFVTLSTYVDPTMGLRFSPYSFINLTTDQLFTPVQVSNLMSDPTVYNWGNYDGSGDPIQSNFSGYFIEFVYDENYVSPHLIGNNTVIGTGNMINNITSTYPTASFVEFHFTGFNPAYSGMDWTSIRLIFENVSGVWKLIGIQHDQWTI